VGHAVAVRLVERAGNLNPILQYLNRWQRSLFQSLGQRLAVQVFHDNEINAVLVADVVQRADVRMIQAGNNFGLALEALTACRIVSKMRRKNLDSDGAVQARVPRPIYFPHSTSTQRSDDLVRAQSRAVRQRHGCSRL